MVDKQAEQQRRKILADIAGIGFCVPGSLITRTTRCGNPTCRCHREPGRLHGPYLSWTRKVGAKTVTRNLSAAQAERYQPWFDNARRLRELVSQLETLSAQVATKAEHWDSKTPAPDQSTEPAPRRRPRPSRGSTTTRYS